MVKMLKHHFKALICFLVLSVVVVEKCLCQNFETGVDDKVYLDKIQAQLQNESREAHEVLLNQTKLLQQVARFFIESKIKENLFKAVRARVEEELVEIAKQNSTTPQPSPRQSRQSSQEDEEESVTTTSTPQPRPGLLPQLASVVTTLFGSDVNVTSYVKDATSFLPSDLSQRIVSAASLIDPQRFKSTTTTTLAPLFINGQLVYPGSVGNGSAFTFAPAAQPGVLQQHGSFNLGQPLNNGVRTSGSNAAISPTANNQNGASQQNSFQQQFSQTASALGAPTNQKQQQNLLTPSSARQPNNNLIQQQQRLNLQPAQQTSNFVQRQQLTANNILRPQQSNFPAPQFNTNANVGNNQGIQQQSGFVNSQGQIASNPIYIANAPPNLSFGPGQTIVTLPRIDGTSGNNNVNNVGLPQQTHYLTANSNYLNQNNNNNINNNNDNNNGVVDSSSSAVSNEEEDENDSSGEDGRSISLKNPQDEKYYSDIEYDFPIARDEQSAATTSSSTGLAVQEFPVIQYALKIFGRLTNSKPEIPTTTEFVNTTTVEAVTEKGASDKSVDYIDEEEIIPNSEPPPTRLQSIVRGGMYLYEGAKEAYQLLQNVNSWLDKVNDRFETAGYGAEEVGVELTS